MKKQFLKAIMIAAIAIGSVSAYAQSPISPVPAGGANAYPGGTPTQSPNGVTPGSNIGPSNTGPAAPIGNGYVGNSGSANPSAVPGSPASGANNPAAGTPASGTSPVNAGSTVPQNVGVNDARNSSIPPHKE